MSRRDGADELGSTQSKLLDRPDSKGARIMRISIAVTAVLLLLNPMARAQTDPYSIGVTFDTAGNIQEGFVPGFAAPTRLYFVMVNLGEQVVGYESSISISGPGSEGWVITRGSVVGLDVDPDPDGYVVGIGVCAGTPGGSYTLNTYDFAYFNSPVGPSNTLICAGPPTVGNPSIPGFPSYQTCGGALEVSPLLEGSWWESACDGCALINPVYPMPCTIVASEETSWGSLKSHFSQ